MNSGSLQAITKQGIEEILESGAKTLQYSGRMPSGQQQLGWEEGSTRGFLGPSEENCYLGFPREVILESLSHSCQNPYCSAVRFLLTILRGQSAHPDTLLPTLANVLAWGIIITF